MKATIKERPIYEGVTPTSFKMAESEGYKGNGESYHNGDGQITLSDLYTNPLGRVSTLDFVNNELMVLRSGGKVVEFLGMPKGGKSKHIELLCETLRRDEELTERLGRSIEVEVFKPNTLAKVLYEKDHNRAMYHETIIHLHGSTLNMLHLQTKGDSSIATREIDLALLDRGPIDDIAWTRAIHDYKSRLLPEEIMERQLEMARDLEQFIDLAVGVNVKPAEAMEREGEGREGNVMNISFLRELYKYYSLWSAESQQHDQPQSFGTSYLDIDGSADRDANAEEVFRKVKGLYVPQRPEELDRNGSSDETENATEARTEAAGT